MSGQASKMIGDEFYQSLFSSSRSIYLKSDDSPDGGQARLVDQALASRTSATGLTPDAVAVLLRLVRDQPDPELRRTVVDAARALRRSVFGDAVSTMVPIEVSSFCASTCRFCGWRADNKDMIRLAITETAIRQQARRLAAKGFSHFEIAGGDDLKFLRDNLPSLVRGLKEEVSAVNPQARVSLCLVPMHEQHYVALKQDGLDCVLTWQETYDEDLYNAHIPSGPKAWGVDQDLRLHKKSDHSVGWMHRMRSQELAIRAGLQAGLGCMIGLADILEADILSVIRHGQELIRHYGERVEPLIIGMPTWNPITTERTDNKANDAVAFRSVENFELVAAIYLLAFPDRRAWVFANGRVPPDIQTNTVATASVFTSTLVQIAPGAYLDFDGEIDRDSIFDRAQGVKIADLTRDIVLSGEQFTHYFDTHENFIDLFRSRGLRVVSDRSLIEDAKMARPAPIKAERAAWAAAE
jgi:2-iminoacetate synthase